MISAASFNSFAQTKVNETVPLKAGQRVELSFDYPELIKITTWDKNEISIEGTVSINSGEHDDAFVVNISNNGPIVKIKNEIRNMKNLPHRVTAFDGAEKIVFASKEEFKNYERQQGKKFGRVSYGLDMDIILEIRIPANTVTGMTSTYGMVEVSNFNGPLTVEATYGGVDVAVNEQAVGKITAETFYGEIFSNLDAKSNGTLSRDDFQTLVSATPGRGPAYVLDSKFGNVYLRKAVQ